MSSTIERLRADASLLLKLEDATSAEYVVWGGRRRDAGEAERSKVGEFVVFPTIPQGSRLEPPIDWQQNPFESQSWCAELHSLRFLDVLFSRYRHDGELDALRVASDIAIDWYRSNPRGHNGGSRMAWMDKVAGDRATFIGYLLRAVSVEHVLARGETLTLLQMALDHIAFLSDDSQYTKSSNHGLFQDLGLVVLSKYLDFHSEAMSWRRTGVERFIENLSSRVAVEDGVYLEHSPAYQWLIVGLIDRFNTVAGVDDSRLHSLRERLVNASGWLALPDRQTPPLGDSDVLPAPKWAVQASQPVHGMFFSREAGVASIREGHSMLLLSAGYHTHTHKHADELGFCLVENDELMVAEAGKYGYDNAHPARKYAISSYAHSVLLVDDTPFTVNAHEPYGGALTRVGQGAGWYAVEGSNPLLSGQQVEHRRLFVYSPGTALFIFDRLTASGPHTYTRLFHLGPQIDVQTRGGQMLALFGQSNTGLLADESEGDVTIDSCRGQRQPSFSGWFFPRYRVAEPIHTVSLTAQGQDATFVTNITLDAAGVTWSVRTVERENVHLLGRHRNGDTFSVEVQALDAESLRIVRAHP